MQQCLNNRYCCHCVEFLIPYLCLTSLLNYVTNKQTLKPLYMLGVQMQSDLGERPSNNVIGVRYARKDVGIE